MQGFGPGPNDTLLWKWCAGGKAVCHVIKHQRDFSAVGGVEFFVVRFCFAVVIVFYPMYT